MVDLQGKLITVHVSSLCAFSVRDNREIILRSSERRLSFEIVLR
jgi:hypothetical protein